MKRRRQRTVDPKKFKKHSDIVQKTSKSFVVPGDREKTKTGYRVSGTSCRHFETYYEVVIKRNVSDRVLHPKKHKTIRVVRGQGSVTMFREGEPRTVTVFPGDEIHFKPEIEYEIASASSLDLEFFVTQSYKYDSSVKVTKETESNVELSDQDLQTLSREEAIEENTFTGIPRRRGTSKAAKQQLDMAVSRGRQVSSPERYSAEQAVQNQVMNKKPSMGNFDWEGAG